MTMWDDVRAGDAVRVDYGPIGSQSFRVDEIRRLRIERFHQMGVVVEEDVELISSALPIATRRSLGGSLTITDPNATYPMGAR